MKWITDWDEIDEHEVYLVCPLNGPPGDVRLGRPVGFQQGWEVKRLLKRCYAAISLPHFSGLPPLEE